VKSINKIRFIKEDLEWIDKKRGLNLFKDINIVFHLAAVHGGRGYISTHPADTSSSLVMDHKVFELCVEAGVEKIS